MTKEAQTSEGIRCTLLPVRGGYLLLPMLALVEVIGYEEPKRPPQSPHWYLGLLPWRGSRLPVVRLAHLGETNEERPSRNRPRRIAVCRGIDEEGAVPFIGMAIQASPHLVVATEWNLEAWTLPDPPPDFALQGLQVSGDACWIPDMDALAANVADLA